MVEPLDRLSERVRSVLYAYQWNRNGAACRFLHVRRQFPGRPHPAPRWKETENVRCSHG